MRRMLTGLCAVLGFALFVGLAAEANAQTIAYVFMEEIRARAQPYQDIQSQLQQAVTQRQQEAEQRQSEIQRLQEQLERQQGLLTENKRAERETQIRQKLMEYEQWAAGAQQDLGRQQLELLQPLDGQVLELIQKIAAEKDYGMVIDGAAILYMRDHEEHNLTDAIIEELNQE
jgi:Skp family chaperone for outer membrane proteins